MVQSEFWGQLLNLTYKPSYRLAVFNFPKTIKLKYDYACRHHSFKSACVHAGDKLCLCCKLMSDKTICDCCTTHHDFGTKLEQFGKLLTGLTYKDY